MKKLPIGIQTFSKIRQGNFCYADKTHLISKMVEQGEHYFLARPRRFGKSLLIDTISEAFAGNKKLFKGLYLESNWDWKSKYPVVKIDFAQGILTSRKQLDTTIRDILQQNASNANITLEPQEDVHLLFSQLIRKLRQETGQPVVVLIDEYDKPILDNITNQEKATELREGLRNFYSSLKALDAHLRFVMLTGVSKFSKVSLFSGLNNLKDITLDQKFGTICGYTQPELETIFHEYLTDLDLNQIKNWYNGYNFLNDPVYNPFDILLYLDSFEFRSYWFESGTPTFLINLFKAKKSYIPTFDNLKIGENLLNSFDVDFIEPEILLFQAGYLTIKEKFQRGGQIRYRLGYPNFEVQTSLADSILNIFTPNIQRKEQASDEIFEALQSNNLKQLQTALQVFFASIPNDWYRKNDIANYEGYYCSVVYCYFTALGLNVIPEDTSNHGRIDMTVIIANRAYIIEFKVNESSQPNRALEQIKEKKYAEKYRDKSTWLVGIEFSKTDRNISSFDWEQYC